MELEAVVLHDSSLTQSVVVQFPFSHFVVILVRNCVLENGRIGLEDKIKMRQITGIQEIIKFDLDFVIIS